MKNFSLTYLLLLICGTIVVGFHAMPALAQDAGKVHELQRVIEAQQKQNEIQQQQLEAQQKQLDAQRQLLQKLQIQIESLATEAEKTVQAPVSATDKKSTKQAPFDKDVPSDVEKRVKLAISGQVNRAVNVVDDGKSTRAYFVDNDNSESRVRFVGTARATDDLTIGSKIELSIAPNKAGEVDQNNQETNNVFDQRWTEVYLDSKRFGKLSLGKGATASYGSATADLSRTGVISYATIADTAGGMLFRQTSDDTLTNIRIVDAFNSFDGLNRRNRVRYDTPTFYGFRLAGSAISDQRYDASLWWGGQGYGFKAAGAAGFAYPNQDGTDFQYDGSFSLLHEDTGLNLTLSAGLLERDNQDDAQNFYAKAGWLTRFFSFGETAFGVDYTRSLNLPTDSDDGYSVAAAAVQQFEKYGTEFYLLYRLHSLDRDAAPSVQDISVGSIGARVKF
jgi:Sec-independent protein translocase protein TatA